ncbi:TonB-dependent receptor domain-containing protein [Sphingomonas sp. Leaf33]|uniref:TonB-dependent receptor domain-containing protein n=1 Tax=Sphingomonas sp. Leaf33 TaxID=1736215 RepID=UPI0009E9D06B|nr:TonB-dependent receptor [Sphingomonas sp. Leaf33]
MALSRDLGVEIVSTEPGLQRVSTRGLSGRLSARAALGRLLAGTGYRAVPLGSGAFRIERVAGRGAAPPHPRRSPAPSAAPMPADVVVTASKRDIPLLRYPGSVTVVDATVPAAGIRSATLSDAARAIPILQSTHLGRGRNKLFIRGIADSSFGGATQSPTSIYLDDVQLNYSGADPGLRLYDMDSVEVLEGPQGTLYGSGAIGGVIRLTSAAVDLRRTGAALDAGVTATTGGMPGGDIAAMVNLPIVDDRLGVRAVAYAGRSGGYIDDLRRGLRDVNVESVTGGRVKLSLRTAGDWRIEASGAAQSIDARDGQYADRSAGLLARRSAIAQPFDNELLFGRVTASRTWGNGVHLLIATGLVGYRAGEQFDATAAVMPAPTTPVVYRSDHFKRLLTHETRLSRALPGGSSWVVGVTLVNDRDELARSVAVPGALRDIIGVTNVTRSASLFGESTLSLSRSLAVTVGARGTSARTDGSPSVTPLSGSFVRGRSTRRIDPTIAASWRIAPLVAAFGRFQTGYRTGGLSVAPGIGRVADFRSDSIVVGELGVRRIARGPIGLALSASVSLAHWDNIQADLISRRGQPYTDNIGNARITAFETALDWTPLPGLRAQGAVLLTDNRVTGPIADLSRRSNRRLPETPPFAAHGALSYAWTAGNVTPRVVAGIDHVGRSVLGTGDLFDISQGAYSVLSLGGGVRRGAVEVTIDIDNLTNVQANRFAYGNPFAFAMREQITPLRPRNVRIGAAYRW